MSETVESYLLNGLTSDKAHYDIIYHHEQKLLLNRSKHQECNY
ncbi:hypothetical protein AB9M75_00550 [Lactobacillus sp. AN1001]